MGYYKNVAIDEMYDDGRLDWVQELFDDYKSIIKTAYENDCRVALPPESNAPELIELFELARADVEREANE